MAETTYKCPRCHSGPRPRDQWASRYGIMTCGVCLNLGYVILPEETQESADFNQCAKCGGPMAHFRLKGYRCLRCD